MVAQTGPNSAKLRKSAVSWNPSFSVAIIARLRPFLVRKNRAYAYNFSARQEPKKAYIGSKDLALFLRPGCGLLLILLKNAKFIMVNDGRLFIVIAPGSYVFYIPKNRLWGSKNGPGAVPQSPGTPRNSRTLRDRSRNKES